MRGQRVRVYAVHLETPFKASDAEREDQVRTVLADAARFDGPVVIAGDFNSYGDRPRSWCATGIAGSPRGIDPTISFFSWDHIFVRHLCPPGRPAPVWCGEVHGASDHRPVWAVVVPECAGALAAVLQRR